VIDLKTTFIGASKVAIGNRITLVLDVARELGIKVGDKVVIEKDESGRLIIRKG
jgi:bifunctional DNA-binding transcriptional regulator/antitoxin component of YhaV-PrlF toxin-antitoxin module